MLQHVITPDSSHVPVVSSERRHLLLPGLPLHERPSRQPQHVARLYGQKASKARRPAAQRLRIKRVLVE